MQSVAEHAAKSGDRAGAGNRRHRSPSLITTAQGVEKLIECLEERGAELRPHAANANQILCSDLIAFLTSEQGHEFAESLRFEALERLKQATTRADELREELREAENNARNMGRVFAFVASVTLP